MSDDSTTYVKAVLTTTYGPIVVTFVKADRIIAAIGDEQGEAHLYDDRAPMKFRNSLYIGSVVFTHTDGIGWEPTENRIMNQGKYAEAPKTYAAKMAAAMLDSIKAHMDANPGTQAEAEATYLRRRIESAETERNRKAAQLADANITLASLRDRLATVSGVTSPQHESNLYRRAEIGDVLDAGGDGFKVKITSSRAATKWLAIDSRHVAAIRDVLSGEDDETPNGDAVSLTEAERFFYDNAPFNHYPETETPEEGRIRCARALAAAEARLKDGPYYIDVSPDSEPDDTDDGPVWVVSLYDVTNSVEGDVIGSLGNVAMETDSDPYIRLVSAELADEYLPKE